jgi:hypothetical protein
MPVGVLRFRGGPSGGACLCVAGMSRRRTGPAARPRLSPRRGRMARFSDTRLLSEPLCEQVPCQRNRGPGVGPRAAHAVVVPLPVPNGQVPAVGGGSRLVRSGISSTGIRLISVRISTSLRRCTCVHHLNGRIQFPAVSRASCFAIGRLTCRKRCMCAVHSSSGTSSSGTADALAAGSSSRTWCRGTWRRSSD